MQQQSPETSRATPQLQQVALEKVGTYSHPIPGAVETLTWLRAQGLKVGSC